MSDETGPNTANLIKGNDVHDNPFACGITMASHPAANASGRKAALRQLLGEQGADQAAANEGDGLLRHAAIRQGNPPTVPQAGDYCNPALLRSS
jgi:hypothetical protein